LKIYLAFLKRYVNFMRRKVRPSGYEPVTLGLEMQGIGYTNDLVLHRFVCLQ